MALLKHITGQIANGWLLVQKIEFEDYMNVAEQEETGTISRVPIGHGLTVQMDRNGDV